MKISWFSPVAPDKTDIANYTSRILPVLTDKHEIALWTGTRDPDLKSAIRFEIVPFSKESIDWKRLNLGGLPVYHIGNNIHFHGDIIQVARKCPGIVVLHDLAVHETVMNHCLYKGHGRPEYFDILYRYGGNEAIELGKDFLDKGLIDTNELAKKYPLFEYVISNCRGVITHNPVNVDLIKAATPAPVMYTPLPYGKSTSFREPAHRQAKKRNPYQIIIFGYLGSSNRRLRPFLEAFSKCGSRERYKVVIAGKYPEKQLKDWIRQLNLGNRVKALGFLSEQELARTLEGSDLCVNLRWPTRGESSGSLLRIWNHSLPAMVTKTDYYATVPQDAVAFVDPANEAEDIINHLDAFARDPGKYYRLGLTGRELLSRYHSSEDFVDNLTAFLEVAETARGLPYPQAMGKSLAQRFLSAYPDAEARLSLTKTCAAEVSLWAGNEFSSEAYRNVGN